jgi:hypothetical protein
MSQPSDERPNHATAERAAEMGERVGRFTSLALRRIEAVARKGMLGQASPAAAGAPDQETPLEGAEASDRPATERAEEMLDGMGERINQLASVAGPGLRKFLALAREEAEDIWAEAQHIRRSNSRDSV